MTDDGTDKLTTVLRSLDVIRERIETLLKHYEKMTDEISYLREHTTHLEREVAVATSERRQLDALVKEVRAWRENFWGKVIGAAGVTAAVISALQSWIMKG